MTLVLEANGLTKRYGRVTAVDRLSFGVEKGSFSALVGSNGSGKSTTLKMCSNLIIPTQGSVSVCGHDICDDRNESMRSIGCVIETPEFYGDQTPDRMLRYLGRLDGMGAETASAEASRVLELVNASEYADRRFGKFSKGMKQRLVIASALLGDPSLLLLDEPTSGLDPRGAYDVRTILRRLNDDGITILMSTHLLNDIDGLCDSMVIIDKGRMIRQGKVSDLDMRPILRVSTTSPMDPALLESVRGLEGVVDARTWKNGLEITFEGNDKGRARLLREILELGIDAYGMEEGNAFEKAFFENTEAEGC